MNIRTDIREYEYEYEYSSHTGTNRLIESIGPEGRCFEKKSLLMLRDFLGVMGGRHGHAKHMDSGSGSENH